MGRDTHILSIDYVAKLTGLHPALVEQVTSNSDNIDYGELISVATGPDEGFDALTGRGIESLNEFISDVRTWNGGIRQFLIEEGCEAEVIEQVMKSEARD